MRSNKLYIDISTLRKEDYATGIQRAVRAILSQFISNPKIGYQVIPVYLDIDEDKLVYRVDKIYVKKPNYEPSYLVNKEIINPIKNDIFLGLDLEQVGAVKAEKSGLYQQWKKDGVEISFIVYDLLPILKNDLVPQGVEILHEKWLKSILKISTKLISISHTVQNELQKWIEENALETTAELSYFHLGADIVSSLPTLGFPSGYKGVLEKINNKITFLIVSTVEPRKGHAQILHAFENLWHQKFDINLVFVGREGWHMYEEKDRKNLPELVRYIRKYRELNKNFFWLESISDEYLEVIYKASNCYINASEGEGFGLPIIEAAKHNLPLILRDIPIFHEVADKHAFYFENTNDYLEISNKIRTWIKLYQENQHPKSYNLAWLTWENSANELLNILKTKREII